MTKLESNRREKQRLILKSNSDFFMDAEYLPKDDVWLHKVKCSRRANGRILKPMRAWVVQLVGTKRKVMEKQSVIGTIFPNIIFDGKEYEILELITKGL